MNDSPVISIACMTFNHGKFIAHALNSFLMQKINFSMEVIVHDDASTDNTEEIIREYTKNHSELFFPIYQQENKYSKGIKPFFQFVIPKCRGKYIAFCEGDDYWTDPYKLQKQVDFLESNKDYVVCFTRFETKDENTVTFMEDNNGDYFKKDGDTEQIEFDFKKFYKGWHIGTQTALIRRECLISYDASRYQNPKDIHLYTHLLLSGKCACLNFFGAVYRKHDGGVYTGTSKLKNLKTAYLAYNDIYRNNKNIFYLKKKKIKYAHSYMECLLENKDYRVAFNTLVENFFIDFNFKYFFKTVQRIISQKIRKSSGKGNLKFENKQELRPNFYNPVNVSGVTSVKRKEKIIISLTSYPARIDCVYLVINTLLCQTLKPDLLILWLGADQFPDKEEELPQNLLTLRQYGLKICWCDDLKSYKKLIPALKEFPDDIIVTADDDIYYPPGWLALLYTSYRNEPNFIHCHRAHKIKFDKKNNILPYTKWEYETKNSIASFLNFITGCGGVLYKRSHFNQDIMSVDLFKKLTPHADDIWFWAMAVLNNTKVKVVENSISSVQLVETTQNESLGQLNWIEGENDRQLARIFENYKELKETLIIEINTNEKA